MTAIQIKPKLTFLEFLENLPDEEGYYELVNGEIMRKLPTRQHETIAELIADIFKDEVKRLKLNYWVSGRVVIATENEDGREQGRHPDVTVVDKTLWESQPTAYSALLDPPQVAVEVVSTNWEDDYIDKLAEYQRFGIVEYWIVDYLAIGSRTYLGNPKQPTIFIFALDEKGVYQMQAYRESDRLISPTFPELNLTPSEIFDGLK
ncbi:MAG: Uma2 family endonuclease [Cyanobacteria bacterium SBLK]|nr:Uma2 family endonuclease [Cyanobacteria bacterium SBLK]